MRLVDLVRAVAPLGMVAGMGLLASRRRLVRAFTRAGATSPETAIPPPPARLLGGWWRDRLQGAGVLAATDAGTWWLRQEAWLSYRAVRRRRAVSLLAILLAIFAVLLVR